jgi:hypothetical protein
MGQVCIMNTSPEFSVSSLNTVCNSRISCVLCVPPIRMKRGSVIGKNVKTSEIKLDDNKMKSKRSEAHYEEPPQSVIDTDSSEEEDCGDSQSDDLLHRNNSTNIPSTNHQSETKYSSMWIGNDDGW